MPNWLPLPLAPAVGIPWQEVNTQSSIWDSATPHPPAAIILLSFDVRQGQSPPSPWRWLNLWWESAGTAVPLPCLPASTIWLVKQIALSSCSPICLLSWVFCTAATAVPQFPPLLCSYSDAIRTAIRVALVSGELSRRQFAMFVCEGAAAVVSKVVAVSQSAAVHLNGSIMQTCIVIYVRKWYTSAAAICVNCTHLSQTVLSFKWGVVFKIRNLSQKTND